MDLQSRLGELRAKGMGVTAISYDPVPTLAEFATRKQITLPLLSDAGSATIKAFDILNPMPEMAFGPDKDDPAVVEELRKYAQAAFRGKESISIEGSFDYQACDDKVCFNPVSVPLTWTMSLKALVTERAPQRQP